MFFKLENFRVNALKMPFSYEYVDENLKTQWYDVCAESYAEAVGKFCIDNPHIPYIDIVDVCSDDDYLS